MEIFDIGDLQDFHSYGALVAIDNTFASPINQQVLALGGRISPFTAPPSIGRATAT